MPLLYLPESEALFLWGAEPTPTALADLELEGDPLAVVLVTPEGRREVAGLRMPLLRAVSILAAVPASSVEAFPSSMATWVLASKLAIELVSRERIIPTVARRGDRMEARWAAALSASEDAQRVLALARSMSPAAHAVPIVDGGALDVWTADALLHAFLDAVVDALARADSPSSSAAPGPSSSSKTNQTSWDGRFRSALDGLQSAFQTEGFGERSVLDDLTRWSAPAIGARDRLRACFRLELPENEGDPFTLRFLLQSPDDPSLMVAASDVWGGSRLKGLGRAFRDPEESLLEALGRASRLFAPLREALDAPMPEALALDPNRAWAFLADGAALLSQAGFGVIVPTELTTTGQRRLRLRMRVGGNSKVAGAVSGKAGLGLDELLAVDWQAVVGDQALSAAELSAIAKQKAPLVRFRGSWVAVDPRELADIRKRLSAGPTKITTRDAIQAALAGETRQGELSAQVLASGSFAEVLDRLRNASAAGISAPATLNATLRPYQERGLNWLTTMSAIGLGACLADDMGLGKTMQLLAWMLRRVLDHSSDLRPALLIAPTSVVGNWEREIARFAPSLRVTPHYGGSRLRTARDFPKASGSLVISTYGLLRRDADLLASVDWSMVALDEAQNIKNAASATARAARALRGSHRFALTGTPVENRLAELWSILEFANPGMLGPLESFRRELAVPIERFGNEEAAGRLRRMVAPLILRRLKSDPTIIDDLPAKNEMKVVCTLTVEQATLYKAVVDEEMRRIEESDGMERRGRVLALLTYTKQICNHPAQYLSDRGALPKRSGKLERVTEMLEEALAAGDKALIFTQFREMGERLTEHLSKELATEVVYLHGGTSKKARDEMVRRFQEEAHGPRIFVLSLKAGGTGLNLTAANHVFHYDRWWNPAVEDQATDRAYRIGQKRAVQVHKLICAGTVEEKIDKLLEEKRALASKVVGSGEQWITELGTSALRDLFALAEGAVVSGDEENDSPVAARAARKPGKRSRRVGASQ